MIYDTLTNSHLYYGISARLQKALDFLVNSDFSTIPDGRYEIDGNDVFANISHGMTVQNTPNAEAHNTYLDIQYLIEGHELIGVAQRETLTEVEAHPERDIWFYAGNMSICLWAIIALLFYGHMMPMRPITLSTASPLRQESA